jgi:hypothetical protein
LVEAAAKLKGHILTNLYEERPRWLAHSHAALGRAAAYSRPEDMTTNNGLARLLELNLERAKAQKRKLNGRLKGYRAVTVRANELPSGLKGTRPRFTRRQPDDGAPR